MKKMKMNIWKLGIVALGIAMSVSCTEIKFGDKFLGDAPESSGSTLETMFSSRVNSEMVLTKIYSTLPYGLSTSTGGLRMGGNYLESVTDLCQSLRSQANDSPFSDYYTGQLSANNVTANKDMYAFGKEADWTGIKYARIYLDNIDRVPDMTAAEKEAKAAEAKTLLALTYFNMLRYIGGVIWLEHSVGVNDDMNFPRSTFAESVENINALLDEAIAVPSFTWKWDVGNDGRMSKAAAMALKFKLLQFAASPMFNSDTKWHPQADEYTCYGNYDRNRWVAAQQAGKAFFDALAANGGYALIQPAAATHQARREAYRSGYYDRCEEILISLRKGNYFQDTYGGDNGTLVNARLFIGPTLNYVDMFPWEDGSEFPADTFDWENPDRDPFFVYTDGVMVPVRDPRLYENVAVPGDIYYNGGNVPSYYPVNTARATSGFHVMKFFLQEAADRANRLVQFPHTRLAEIMLGYAEVLNEVNNGPTAEAYKLVNDVRARVGLSALPSGMNHDSFFETVLRERAMELGFEEVRWYDLIRYTRAEDFRKTLYGLDIVGDKANATSFTYKKVELTKRYWATNWDTKWYLSPIPTTEINKNYGMTQNPGW